MLYIDNTAKKKLDENGRYVSNWNPDKKYGDYEYAEVYFRIESGYEWGKGMPTGKSKTFYKEVQGIFQKAGWGWNTERNDLCDGNVENWGCGYIKRDKENIYLHPMDFSGEILKNSVKEIVSLMGDSKTFCCNAVDIYENVYDLTDEEYKNCLETVKGEMQEMLFTKASTKRRTLYYNLSNFVNEISSKIMFHRIGEPYCEADNITKEFIYSLIKEMAEDGYFDIIEQPDKIWIRSINKTELKKKRLSPAFV